MARARNIKPGFFKNEDLAECTPWARLLFAGLWLLADREGRLEDRPKRIKAELFAFDSIEVAPLLDELERYGFILRYSAQGKALIQVVKFSEHQNPHHREPASSYPPPESPGPWDHGKAPKPGAEVPLDEVANPVKPEASPGLDPPRDDLEWGSNRADSGFLIPDSGFRNPDPGAQPALAAAAAVCIALRKAGIADVQSQHPVLLALLAQGATQQEFVDAVPASVGKRDPFAYLLGVVKGRREAAARIALPSAQSPPSEGSWCDTRSSIEAKGVELGLGPWNRDAFDHGQGETFAAYTERVRRAANQ